MRVILDQLITNLENGRPAVTGAIIRSTGSAPRGEGARMLVTSGGSLYGTIGGGELEGQSIAKAKTMLVESNNTDSSSRYQLLDFQLSTAEAALSGMVCGGSQQVLLQMIEPSGDNLAFFSELRDKFRNGLRPVLLTFVNGSDQPQLKMYSPDLELPAALRSDVSRKAENGGFHSPAKQTVCWSSASPSSNRKLFILRAEVMSHRQLQNWPLLSVFGCG